MRAGQALGWVVAALLGFAAAGGAAAQGGGTATVISTVGRGGGAELLFVPKVQADLKLSDPQKTQVRQLEEQMARDLQGLVERFQGTKPEERPKLIADLIAGHLKQAMTILTPEQQTRFRQLSLQTQGTLALAQAEVASELKLTPEQRERVGVIVNEQQAALVTLVRGGLGSNAQQQVEGVLKETENRILPLLTDDQKARWKELLGPPLR